MKRNKNHSKLGGEVVKDYVIIMQGGKCQTVVGEFDTPQEVVSDMYYRDPAHFFIGVTATHQGYTLEEFEERYLK